MTIERDVIKVPPFLTCIPRFPGDPNLPGTEVQCEFCTELSVEDATCSELGVPVLLLLLS